MVRTLTFFLRRMWRETLREMARELLFCVLLPGLVFLSADVVAQKAIHTTTQQHSDDQIANTINTRIMASNTLRPLDLGVWVHDGTATLSGTVPTQAIQDQVDSLVRVVPGVKLVDDRIMVGATPQSQSRAQSQASPQSGTAPLTPEGETAQAISRGLTPGANTTSGGPLPDNAGAGPVPQAGQGAQPGAAGTAPGTLPSDAGPGPAVAGQGVYYPNGAPAQQPSGPPAEAGNAPNGAPGNVPNNTPGNAPGYPPSNMPPSASQLRRSQMQRDQPMMTIAQGTPLYVQVLETLDSHHTKPGMDFHGVLAQSVAVNGVTALPRGALVEGTVIDARAAGHLAGGPRLALQLSNINIGDASYVLTTQDWAHQGPGKGGQTAGMVAGSAAFGVFAGAMFGGGPVALLGAAIGGLGGAGMSALTPRAHILVPAESVLTFRLTVPLTVREPTVEEVRNAAANAPPERSAPQRRRPAYYPYPPPPPPPYYYPY